MKHFCRRGHEWDSPGSCSAPFEGRECGCPLRCAVCGGVHTCPAEWHLLPAGEDDISRIPADGPVPEGWRVTHWKRGYRIAVRTKRPDGAEALIVGTAQAARVKAHFGFDPLWVGQCSYLVYESRSKSSEVKEWSAKVISTG